MQFCVLLQKEDEQWRRQDSGGTGFACKPAPDLGILDDASPFEKLGFWVESQTGLQDLQIDETESKKQTKETASGKGERALTSTYLSQCDVEYGFYARYFGEW